MLKVLFRVDAGKRIGMGHLMRCLSLADSFRERGHRVFFLCKEDSSVELVIKRGFELFKIPEELCAGKIREEQDSYFYGDKDQLYADFEFVEKACKDLNPDVLIIDKYNLTSDYFSKMKGCTKALAYIDDVNEFDYPVDILINGNINAMNMGYTQSIGQLFLLGIDYNLIRSEFRCIERKKIREDVKSILMTTGGADPYMLTPKFLQFLVVSNTIKDFHINIVIGPNFIDLEPIYQYKEAYSNIELYSSKVPEDGRGIVKSIDMKSLFVNTDLAISSGGSTLYELCACGTPTLAYILAENQSSIIEEMSKMELVESLGRYNDITEHSLISSLKNIIKDYPKREYMSQKGRNLVDAKGTLRVVEKIEEYMTSRNFD